MTRWICFSMLVVHWLIGCSEKAEIRPQLIVRFDTDAPVPSGIGNAPRERADTQPALVDTLRIQVLLDRQVEHQRWFGVDAGDFAARDVSIGVVTGFDASVLIRATLYTSTRIDSTGEPIAEAAIDVVSRLAAVEDAIATQLIELPTERWGARAPLNAAADAQLDRGRPSKVGTWGGADRTECHGDPEPDSGYKDGETCVGGGAAVVGDHRLTGQGLNAEELRLVSISPFFIDEHEYTVARYRRALERGFASQPRPLAHSADRATDAFDCTFTEAAGPDASEQRPLNCVNWQLANALCVFEGRRLPTETEWEFEASGRGQSWMYPWGDLAPECDQSVFSRGGQGYWHEAAYKCAGGGRVSGPDEVGSAAHDLSISGAYDMAGNVMEWSADYFASRSDDCWVDTAPRFNPACDEIPSQMRLASGLHRTLRGGNWVFPESSLRVAARNHEPGNAQGSIIGFRCARDG